MTQSYKVCLDSWAVIQAAAGLWYVSCVKIVLVT